MNSQFNQILTYLNPDEQGAVVCNWNAKSLSKTFIVPSIPLLCGPSDG